MSLLNTILNDVISDEVRISNILRKCLVLGYEIDHSVFIDWLNSELSGYTNKEKLPSYRKLPCAIQGDFAGWNSRMTGMPIDLYYLDERIRKRYEYSFMMQSISEIESLSYDTKDNVIGYAIPPSYLGFITSPYSSHNCYRAWVSVSKNALVSIVDEVKNKILKTLLDIKKEVPDAKDVTMDNLDKKQKETINQIINNNFTTNISGSANVANSSENFHQSLQIQSDELIEQLITELIQIRNQGTDIEVIDKVVTNLESMKGVKEKSIIMEKLVDIMTIAGGAASVTSAIMPYIEPIKKLFI
ncbi:hypothetical protein [Providencia rettgeri]|uniref:AbiTii domain-containing protein n=1 Tax=Providencia rettgeri TaxID=587 RepID=UPI00235FAAAF|nr:hypothetical protein [Providencia rettgeri]